NALTIHTSRGDTVRQPQPHVQSTPTAHGSIVSPKSLTVNDITICINTVSNVRPGRRPHYTGRLAPQFTGADGALQRSRHHAEQCRPRLDVRDRRVPSACAALRSLDRLTERRPPGAHSCRARNEKAPSRDGAFSSP